MTEYELFKALRPLYPPAEYALLPQVANGTGAKATRHADAVALGLWPSRGMHMHGFEMKSYRGDWLRELRNPAKAESIAEFCHFWWVVASGPFIEAAEVPELWGLLIWDREKGSLERKKPAKFREAKPMDLDIIAGILRKAQDVATPDAALAEARQAGSDEGFERGKTMAQYEQRDFLKLQERVKKFEESSGVAIDQWQDASDIGEAVKQVLQGTVMRGQERLIRVAQDILRDLDCFEPIEPREKGGKRAKR